MPLSQSQRILESSHELVALLMSDLSYQYNIGGLAFIEASRKVLENKPPFDTLI